jgi:hypothetical protein
MRVQNTSIQGWAKCRLVLMTLSSAFGRSSYMNEMPPKKVPEIFRRNSRDPNSLHMP